MLMKYDKNNHAGAIWQKYDSSKGGIFKVGGETISGIGQQINLAKLININVANNWYDTGIAGNNLESGTYIMEVYINGQSKNAQFIERLSGIVAWHNSSTNSENSDEIPLSKAGHARNNHDIKLRTKRNPGGTYNVLKLQISDSSAWNAEDTVYFRFRKLI